MNESTNILKEIILHSFFSEEEKQLLIDDLGQQGANDSFFELFQNMFETAFKQKGELSNQMMQEFEDGFQRLRNGYEDYCKRIEKEMENNLLETDILDLEKKGQITDLYYQEIKLAQTEFETKAKELYRSIMTKVI
jgi:hypothetical protein